MQSSYTRGWDRTDRKQLFDSPVSRIPLKVISSARIEINSFNLYDDNRKLISMLCSALKSAKILSRYDSLHNSSQSLRDKYPPCRQNPRFNRLYNQRLVATVHAAPPHLRDQAQGRDLSYVSSKDFRLLSSFLGTCRKLSVAASQTIETRQ